MIDLTNPEVKQAYLLGIEAGKANYSTELDRVAQVTETRIVRELDQFRRRLNKQRSTARGRIVAQCIAIIQGEEFVDE
jgi:hypothetical protein